uniref:hypothetical protein n=1 Tax=Nonomuraea montanisoli TaxID=2741721 RepID=UPI001F33808A|nr:hypothetical protein [Nonomuraea montanisoli]
MAHLDQRAATDRLDHLQGVVRLFRPAAYDMVGHARLHRDQSHAVRDHVVQFARDPQPFLRHLLLGETLGVARRVHSAFAYGAPDRPRAPQGGDAEQRHIEMHNPGGRTRLRGSAHRDEPHERDQGQHGDRHGGRQRTPVVVERHDVQRVGGGDVRDAHDSQHHGGHGHREHEAEDRHWPHAPQGERQSETERDGEPDPWHIEDRRGRRQEQEREAQPGQEIEHDQLASAEAPGEERVRLVHA